VPDPMINTLLDRVYQATCEARFQRRVTLEAIKESLRLLERLARVPQDWSRFPPIPTLRAPEPPHSN
jgi:hypothetical protein